MGRILAIDYGLKRTGLAVTDPLRIIATALETVETSQLISFLKKYFEREQVDEAVIGMPKQMSNEDSQIAPQVRTFVELFKSAFVEEEFDAFAGGELAGLVATLAAFGASTLFGGGVAMAEFFGAGH